MSFSLALALGVALASASNTSAASAFQRKPHIVFILADDYGWGNLGVHRRGEGSSKQAQLEVHTPNLDGLIDEGLLLERHYAYKICSPSRSSLQSGRLAVHVNAVNTGVTFTKASDPVSGAAGIPRNMTGMAQKLREGGYQTHMVGKWDAGMATPEHTPWGRGYDTWLGYFQHANDYWRKNMPIQAIGEMDNCLNSFKDLFMHNSTYRGGLRDGLAVAKQCLEDPSAHEECYEEHLFKERALAVIREHDRSDAASPLFLFYSFHLLHTPLQVPGRYLEMIDSIVTKGGGSKIDSANRRLYAAMTMYMDGAVGEIVSALKANGMWDNTLLVFSSDNGGPVYEPGSGNNHPLKGGKYNDFEGGVRVNAFVSGGFIPREKRGTKFDGVLSIADWYGTFCELAGVDATDHAAAKANERLRELGLPLLPPVDSVAQWGFILNGTNGRPILHLSEQALLQWPFKIVVGTHPYGRWTGSLFPNCSTIDAYNADKGPGFADLKVFGRKCSLSNDASKEDELLWNEDCSDGCLFNIDKDPTEHNDLAKDLKHAAVLAELVSGLKAANLGNFNPDRGAPSVQACMNSIDIGGFYGPFLHTEGWYSPVPQKSLKQQVEDAALKKGIRLVSTRIVEEGLTAVVQEFLPMVRARYAKQGGLDMCLPQAEDSLVV